MQTQTEDNIELGIVAEYMNFIRERAEEATEHAAERGVKSDPAKMHGDDPVTDSLDPSNGTIDSDALPVLCDNPDNLKSLAVLVKKEMQAHLVNLGYDDQFYVKTVTAKPYNDGGDKRSLHLIILVDELA